MKYLIIDLSYYTFYRFFATKQWYKHAHNEETFNKDYNWSENIVFWEKFNKMYIENIFKFIKKYKIEKVIFAKDCHRQDIWRMSFYNDYKSNRESDSAGIGNIFKKSYSEILPALIDNNKIRLIYVPQLEADDIIYLTSKKILENNENNQIWVVSSDHDLLQIITPNITLMDAKMKSYNHKSYGSKYKDIFMKCILGDTSDFIEQAFPKRTIGHKNAIKCVEDTNLLLDKFTKYPGSFDKFALNHLLIDFSNIPHEFITYYNEHFEI